ncbi:MAG: tryptophanase [Bacteroidales bacterium]
MELPFAESYKIKMTEPIYRSNRKQREEWIREADYNLFNVPARRVYIDLLTDSGTGAMSQEQWSAMMMGDESYAGASSFLKLKEQVKHIFGFDYFLPTHQGRAAENVLFSVLVKPGDIIPGNSHFDTTKGHIESRKAVALDCTIDEAKDTQLEIPFKGNVDLNKLRAALEKYHHQIPFILMTITNNTAGGQPVSMENIKGASALAKEFGKPMVIDSARFAENAYFIKTREEAYKEKSIREIVREIYSYADGMTMSAKKDGIVNMGGILAMNNKEWYEKASVYCIMNEGFVTYGGMSGRDMEALRVGLDESTQFDYLQTRIHQIEFLAGLLDEYEIPYQRPAGGHAIFVDALKLLPNVPQSEFPAQTLCTELYLEAGIRGVEIGTILADRDPITRENRFTGLELCRLAIPRKVYTDNHMKVVAAALYNIKQRSESIRRGYQIVHEAPIMRHFTVKLKPAE